VHFTEPSGATTDNAKIEKNFFFKVDPEQNYLQVVLKIKKAVSDLKGVSHEI
jgi:hypothetical protein